MDISNMKKLMGRCRYLLESERGSGGFGHIGKDIMKQL